jgi:Ca-activated chloride channel family protein
VTALYEVVPVGQPWPGQGTVDPLKYQGQRVEPCHAPNELLTVKLRYKEPDGNVSRLTQLPVEASAPQTFEEASRDFKFALAVAGFGLKLRGSSLGDQISWKNLRNIAAKSLGEAPAATVRSFSRSSKRRKSLQTQHRRKRAFEE